MARILVVDDERNIRETVARALELEGYETATAGDGREALSRIDAGGLDAAVVDLSMPGMGGLELLEALSARGDALPIIVLTAHGSIETAVQALRQGAFDFLQKPPERERLLHAVRQAQEHRRLQLQVSELRGEADIDAEMIGSGPAMQELREQIALAAPSDGRVLVLGENGTGKELVARAIHAGSKRAEGSFIKVNCAALPETLFESELFGHVKGAFTGAARNRTGKFEAAHGGTLFLDEVGEIPATLQAKLLRAIETGEVERLGGNGEFRVDVRIVAATNRDLEKEIAGGGFRRDLFYRLDVLRLVVPPLRRRREDIPALADLFLSACCRRNGYPVKTVADEAMQRLGGHDYPGNVRELRNTMERLAILTPGEHIAAADVARVLGAASGGARPAGPLKQQVEDFERAAVLGALERHGWKMAEAARALGLERSHLYKKMKSLGIQRPD